MDALTQHRMTADEFIAWSMARPDGQRFELLDGEVVPMAPERWYHAKVKGRVFRRLEEAVEQAGLACDVLPDAMAVRVNAGTVYEPDAALRASGALDRAATQYDDPLVIVEVLSLSTQAIDVGLKLADYFTLPSLRHYLILRVDTPSVIHHERGANGIIRTRVLTEGSLRFDPPGIALDVGSLFP
jgi:Uma2 family endonuclease